MPIAVWKPDRGTTAPQEALRFGESYLATHMRLVEEVSLGSPPLRHSGQFLLPLPTLHAYIKVEVNASAGSTG